MEKIGKKAEETRKLALDSQHRLANGWNTWNTWSMLSHVLLPQGLEINLAFRDGTTGTFLDRAVMGRSDVSGCPTIRPGPRSLDGTYTELELDFGGTTLKVTTASHGPEMAILVEPVLQSDQPLLLIAEVGLLWNRPGWIGRQGDCIKARLPDEVFHFGAGGKQGKDPNIPSRTSFITLVLDEVAWIWCGSPRNKAETRAFIEQSCLLSMTTAGPDIVAASSEDDKYFADCLQGLKTVIAWDTVYDPGKNRVISPVSRYWSADLHGGYVLFCWDSYFAATLASAMDRDLAYANALAITEEIQPDGYVAIMNCPLPKGTDRSQPPVGALTTMGLYRRFGEPWLLEAVFDDLYRWNGWWLEARNLGQGLLTWGYEQGFTSTIAALESGLDNSPMYDDVPFDEERLIMLQADVGLTALHAMDSELLASMATILGRTEERRILEERRQLCLDGLELLWDEQRGLYLNKSMIDGSFSPRLSPTLFYPLLTGTVAPERAHRMVQEHYWNPEEFFGEWMLPSITRNDPAYPDQDYWRGRIWGPLNWLVYLGLRRSGQSDAASDLACRSGRLFLKEWRSHRHVHENYNSEDGSGCPDGRNSNGSDPFYHWGALLALTALVDAGISRFDPWEGQQ